MKILQIVNSLECGGAEKVVIHLCLGLMKRSNEVVIVCLGKKGELAKDAEDKGVKVVVFERKKGFDFRLLFKLRSYIKNEKFDAVHTHNMGPLIYGGLALMFTGVNLVNTRHGRAKKIAGRFIWNAYKRIIAVSNDAKNEMLKCNPLKDDDVKVIYNAVDIDEFSCNSLAISEKEIYQDIGVDKGSQVIGIVARLSEEKDHETLIKSFKLVVDKGFKADLVIVGDGSVMARLECLVEELNVKDNVKFLGFRDDVSKIMQIFDIFVLSSLTEGISLTLLEAMAASKPIVATNVGGNPEVVVDGKTGLLVPPKDPQKMADAIMKVLSDPDLAKRMGEAGRKRVEEKFSLNRMTSEYIRLYMGIM